MAELSGLEKLNAFQRLAQGLSTVIAPAGGSGGQDFTQDILNDPSATGGGKFAASFLSSFRSAKERGREESATQKLRDVLLARASTDEEKVLINSAKKDVLEDAVGNQLAAVLDTDETKEARRVEAAQKEATLAKTEAETAAIQTPEQELNEFRQKEGIKLDNKIKELGAKVTTGFKDKKQVTDVERDFRKEFNGLSKDFILQRDANARIQASGKNPSAAGDLALIFNFMKILDPGSTVREGEFANAQNSGGVSDRVKAQYNSIISGKRLSKNQRSDFLDRGSKLFNEADRLHKRREDNFTGLAKRAGVNPKQVVTPLGALEQEAKKEVDTKPSALQDKFRRIIELRQQQIDAANAGVDNQGQRIR